MARWHRRLPHLVGIVLVASACFGGSSGETTTTAPTGTTTAATTTTTATTTTLTPNGSPIASAGDRNEVVAAFQFLLNCNGHGPLDVDGVFGPATQSAVEQAQISLGRETTGAPDDATLGLLSRDCSDSRRIDLTDGQGLVVGNVAETDPDTYFVRSADTGRLTAVVVSETGSTVLDVRAAEGSSLASGSAAVAAPVGDDLDYVVQVSTDGPPVTYRLYVGVLDAPSGTIAPADDDTVVLDGEVEAVTGVCLDATGQSAFVAETGSGYLIVATGAVGSYASQRAGIGAAVEFVYRDGSPGYHGFVSDFEIEVGERIVGSGPVFLAATGRAGDDFDLAFDFARTAAPCGGGEVTTIVLYSTGLGVVDFGGTDADVVRLVREALPDSSPIIDTGWIDVDPSANEYGVCRGSTTEIRVVQIDNLTLYFTDGATSWSPAGTRHFAAYRATQGVFPLTTANGVGPGDSIADVLAAHADSVTAPGLQGGVDVFIASPPAWDQWLRATAAGAGDPGDTAAVITAVIGGRWCDR